MTILDVVALVAAVLIIGGIIGVGIDVLIH